MGFIGSYLVKEFDDFIGLDIKEGNDILTCDLPDADVIIHLAAEPSVVESIEDPFHNAMTNIMGTIRLAERYKDSRFIFASSGGAIQETIESPYGLSKYCCEEYIKMLCNDYVILRFPNVYGANSRSVIDKFLSNDIDIWGKGDATRTYAHVSDIISGIIQSMKWEKGLYKLGTDQNYTVLELAQATGKPLFFSEKKKGELLHSSLKNETPGWMATIDAIDYIKERI
jgi:UDP-glucose 4-epimerase